MVIVTGGSKGIGEGCARVFVDAGAKVVICARGDEAGQKLGKELNDKGPGRCDFIQCDVSKPKDIRRLIEQTVRLHGGIDCLINNAGYHPPHKIIDNFTEEEFKDVLQVNLIRLLDSHQVCGRSGTNEEVGQLCLFLASDAASYLTGIEIIISGGSELGYGVKWPLRFIK